jgi:hypothetical protein
MDRRPDRGCGLDRSIIFPVLIGLGPVRSRFFCSLGTGLPSTIDDILIFTKTIEEHQEVTRRVLKLLQEHKLFLKPDKCEFAKTKVEYLDVVVSHNSVEMDPVKVAGVTDWPAPTNRKEVQSFLPPTRRRSDRTMNQELEQYLRVFINQQQDDWTELLPLAEFQYNNHIHSSTQHQLFLLETGRLPRMGFEPDQPLS